MRIKKTAAVLMLIPLIFALTACNMTIPGIPITHGLAGSFDADGNVKIYVPACGGPIVVDSIEIDIDNKYDSSIYWVGEKFVGDVEPSGGVTIVLTDKNLWSSVKVDETQDIINLKDHEFTISLQGSQAWGSGFSAERIANFNEGTYSYNGKTNLSTAEVEADCIDKIAAGNK